MPENLFLEMARRGLRMPIGTDLLLHESSDPEACKHDAQLLGAVVEAAARQFSRPRLAVDGFRRCPDSPLQTLWWRGRVQDRTDQSTPGIPMPEIKFQNAPLPGHARDTGWWARQ